jgi:hypothetical protein
LDEIQITIVRVFLVAIHSHLYSFALRFIFLPTHAPSYKFYYAITVIPDRNASFPRNPCPETSTKLYVHEFGFWVHNLRQ